MKINGSQNWIIFLSLKFIDHEDKTKILLVKLADSGANFKSTKSFKITQSNKLSNDSSNPSNRFMNTNGMSQFVDPAINNVRKIEFDSQKKKNIFLQSNSLNINIPNPIFFEKKNPNS